MPDGGFASRPRTVSGGLTVSGSGRNRPRVFAHALRGLAAVLLFAAAGLVAMPERAQAQDTLVSNTGQSDSGSRTVGYNSTFKFSAAQAFTTGGNTDGYTLTEVKAEIDSTDDENPLVSIYSASGGEPDTSLFTLSNPPSVSANSLNTFSVTGTQTLSANTTYFVVFQQAGASGVYRIETTNSNNQDSGAASGWSIGDDVLWKNQDANDWSTHTRSLQIDIVGSAVTATNTAPTAANNTVTTDEDTNHVFAATEFNFSDDDAGDTLASVKITTLEAAGRLKLGDDDVILNQIVTKTQIDEGKLKFVPDADANGSSYATFGFKVSDGTDESASAYTMTIDVTAVNDPPTAEDNTVTTEKGTEYTFTATDFGFEDVDGDDLASVKITILEDKGRLELDFVDVTEDQVITKANIEGGKLTFAPAFGESGDNYTTFAFTVNDGTVDSEDAYTMTVNVSGKPAITGTAQVGKALTAGMGDITDADGLPTFPDDFTFQWTRVDLDGSSNPTNVGSDSETYEPTAADVGKRLTVTVTFDDLESNAEERTSEASNAVAPAADLSLCPGDDTDVWCATLTSGGAGRFGNSAQGFDAAAGLGGVVPPQFDFDGVTYTVTRLVSARAPGFELAFGTSPNLPAHGAGLSLHVQTFGGETGAAVTEADFFGGRWVFPDFPHGDADYDGPLADISLLRGVYIRGGIVEDGTDPGTEVAVRLSYDAARDPRLSDLEVENAADGTDIALTPSTFDAATTTYTASVANGVSQVTIKPTANGSGATFEYLDHAGTEIDDDDDMKADWQVPLPVGVNRIRVKVTAETGGATETYMLVITRAAPNATTALVSNTGQTEGFTIQIGFSGAGPFSQTFTTGSNSAGYHLSSVGVHVKEEDLEAGESFNAYIYTVKSNGRRDVQLYTLQSPDSYSEDAVNTFEAPPGATLEADTDYMVLLQGTGNALDDFKLSSTASNAEDAGKEDAMWSIENAYRDNNSLASSGWAFLIAVNGSAIPVVNNAPTAADNTVTTAEDTAYTFEADDFGFEDDDAGDTLASVKITTLEDKGDLELDGTAVAQDDVITKADIDGGKLVFTPASGESGTGYTTFGFKVNDGTEDSASAYTMTIDVTAADTTPAAGILVSNTGQTKGSTGSVQNMAQQFTTGPNEDGYVVTEARVYLANGLVRSNVTRTYVTINSDNGGTPGATVLASLSNPSSFTGDSVNAFTLETPLTLAKETKYWVVFNVGLSTSQALNLGSTSESDEDSDSLPGWSIADGRRWRVQGATTWSTSAAIVPISIHGYAAVNSNTAADGAPAITGTPQAGQTLTAGIGTIADTDGLANQTFPDDYTFQWVRVDGGTGTDISGATSATYTLTGEDVGKTVRVKVSFEDDDGNSEGPLESVETAAVLAAAEDCTADRAGADWCTTLTVGTHFANPVVSYGFDGEGSPQYGALEDDTIEYGGTDFTVEIVRYFVSPLPGASRVQIILAAFLSRGTVFDLGGQEFTADASSEGSAGTYQWTLPAGMSWLEGQQVTVSAVLGNFPPTASDNTVTTAEDTAYTFTAEDFGFEDLDGDDLASVKITALEDEGDLELDDADVTEDQVVTKADIDAGKLVFTPASGESGDDYATFDFTVNDGTDDSASEYTMTIDVTAAEANATGAPAIAGVPQAGMVLTAGIGTIADADGLPDDFPDDYTFQWVRTLSGTETDISGATSGTYTLAAADVGATIRVEVSFDDDDDNAEGPLASADTAPVVAAADDCATDRAGADWCTTLTVGSQIAGPWVQYGFNGVGLSTYGALENDTIDNDGTDFTVEYLLLTVSTGNPALSEVQVALDAFLQRRTVFDLGGTVTFTTDFASETSNLGRYEWDLPSGMSWIEGQQVTVSAVLGDNFAPTASDGTIVTATDTPFELAVEDFGYEDADDDPLSSVRIASVATDGVLALNGTAVARNQVVTRSDIDAGNLVFTPGSGEMGDPYATFGFRVSDGTDDSGGAAYTMTVDVTDSACEGEVRLIGGDGVDSRGDVEYCRNNVYRYVCDDEWNSNAAHVACRQAGYPRGAYEAKIGSYYVNFVSVDFWLDDVDCDGDETSLAECRRAPWGEHDCTYHERAGAVCRDDTVPTGAPAIAGTAKIGETLTASTSGISDADGTTKADNDTVEDVAYRDGQGRTFEVSYGWSYQWIRVAGDGTETDVGSDQATYTLVEDDVGNRIRVEVRYFDDGANPEGPLASPETALVASLNAAPTGKPAISGPPQVGKTLTAGIGDVADGDDLPSTVFPAGYTFQWIEVDGATETDIAGATSRTYTPMAGNVAKAIRVRVGYTDGGGTAETVESDATWAVMPAAQSNCGANTVWCATLTVGQLDSNSDGVPESVGFDGSGGFGSAAPAGFTIGGTQYTVTKLAVDGQRDVKFSTDPDLPASGAGLTLRLQNVSGERALRLNAAGADPGADWLFASGAHTDSGDPASAVSVLRNLSASDPLPADTDIGTEVAVRLDLVPNVPATGRPSVAGVAAVRQTLTAGFSGIVDANGLPDAGGFACAWFRVDGGMEIAIPGADSCLYRVEAADEGAKVKVKVSFTDRLGYAEGPIASAAWPAGSGAIGPAPVGEEGELRLTGGLSENEGILEVFHAGQWGTVCDDRFTSPGNRAPEFACELMGFAGGSYAGSRGETALTEADQPIWLDDVRCFEGSTHWTGSEPEGLQHCWHAGWGLNNCDHSQDVKLQCAGTSMHQSLEPLTAAFLHVPVSHGGAGSSFTLRVSFSAEVEISLEDLRDHALSATGGTIAGVTRVGGSKALFEVTVAPSGDDAVSVALAPPPGGCAVEGAVCTAEGVALTVLPLTLVRGPGPGLTVADAEATEGTDDSLDFVVTLDPPAAGTVTVGYATSDGTATAPADYASKNGTLTFDPGETSMTVSVDIEDDTVEDSGETMTLTLSGATGAAIDDAEATGTIYNTEPLTASFSSVAREHDGSGVFLVELDFSEDVEGLSYRTLKFGGIEVTGGTVRRAKRRPPGSGQGKYWTIHVKPDTDGDVTVVLPETVDCAAMGAVCTLDGRMLSNGSRATVPGPGSVPLVSVAAVASPVPEGTAAAFTLRRRGGPATALTVDVTVTEDGSMVDGEAPVSATFAAGSATAALTVATADDEVAEVASAVTATVPAGTGQAPEPGAESASVTVADDDAAPVVVTATPVPAAENGTAIVTLAATDADTAVEALAWSLVGGADRDLFTLDAAGVLAFGAAKDFEAPDDADADGGYEVVVRVTDGANAVDTALTVRLTDADDAAPTGLPEISGAARVGEVLTASVAGIEDADGLTEPGFAWQWIANDGNEDADIEGATDASWTLTAAEQGKTIRVRVTFTDDGGAEEVLESAATAAVAAALPQVSIRADASPVTEGAAAAFTLTRTGAAAEALTVAVSVGEAGAVLSATPPAAATFAAGDAETALSVATENDAVDEADARVTAAVAAGTGYAVDPEAGSAGVDVYDDDAAAPGEPVVTTLWSTTLEWTDMNGEWLVANADDFADAGWSEDGSAFTVWYFAYGPFDGELWLRLNSSGSAGDVPRAGELTLEIGEETVAAGDALSAFAAGRIGIAGEVWRDWEAGDRVPVRLTRTETAEAAASLPGLTVEDAQVREADGLPLSFTVTLDDAQASAVSVRYATSDGTAVAPADYGARSGMLRFEPGETVKTVLVPVIADDHNEGSETMTLALSQPFGAAIADGTATGTIVNTGPIPRAWLARFGRTVADQVLAAVEERLRAPRVPRSEIGLAGRRLGLGALFGGEAGRGAGKADGGGMAGADNADAGAGEGSAGGSRPGWTVAADAEERARLEALTAWLKGEDPGSEEEAQRTRTMTGREVLMGSSFNLAGETGDGGFAALWGRMAQSRFAGREGALGVDGEVTTGLLGLDRAWDRWTAGLVVSRSAGKGGYGGEGSGGIEATVTAVTPWAGYAASERVSFWGAAGYGEGELTVTPDEQAAMTTDLSMKLAAAGARGRLAGRRDGPRLDAAAGARWVRTSSARLSSSDGNLAAASADVWRLTLGLEGSWRLALGERGTVSEGAEATPRLALGLRHDGGDAETGYGVDIAGGLDIALPAEGLTASLSGRGVLTHEAAGLSDRGIAGTLAWDPDPASGRGPSLSLGQTFGNGASSGKDALLARETLEGLAANDNSGAGGDEFDRRRLEARFGYGFGMFGGGFTGTPEVGLNAADTGREAVLGWRLEEERRRGLAFGFDVEAARRESGGGSPGHRIDLGFGWRLESAGGGGFEVRFEGSRLDPGERRAGVRLTARW